ncbi:MAG: hypothetical protein FD189_2382 [Elusimicrobia bacterium]|nr:MAG: hypothetical protein FD154_2359 [Elusimicrobiota bacterium]KAF0153454.1 MAG: hypothetical protein FD189_2382 [Elusimicrobiota bacterium]
MPLTSNLIIAFLTHAALLVFFPYGGKMAFPFTVISFILWTGFFIFIRPATINFKRSNAVFIELTAVFMMALAGLGLMPQTDGVAPLYKLIRGEYPDGRQVYVGLAQFGIKLPSLLPPEKPQVEEEIRF